MFASRVARSWNPFGWLFGGSSKQNKYNSFANDFALQRDRNQLLSWGENTHGQRGMQLFVSFLSFYFSFLISRDQQTIVSISLIPLYKLYMHSCNACESLGHGDLSPYNEPKLIDRFRDYSVLTMSCGMNHAACVTDDGRPWTWGSNDYMQVRTHTHSPERFVPFHHHYILHEIEYRIE